MKGCIPGTPLGCLNSVHSPTELPEQRIIICNCKRLLYSKTSWIYLPEYLQQRTVKTVQAKPVWLHFDTTQTFHLLFLNYDPGRFRAKPATFNSAAATFSSFASLVVWWQRQLGKSPPTGAGRDRCYLGFNTCIPPSKRRRHLECRLLVPEGRAHPASKKPCSRVARSGSRTACIKIDTVSKYYRADFLWFQVFQVFKSPRRIIWDFALASWAERIKIF